MDISRLSTAQRISAVSILVTALAAFLPWVSLFGISALGVDGDGVITLILAVAGGAVLAITSGLVGKPRDPGKGANITLLVFASLTALIALLDMNGAAAIGLYLTMFAGIAWVAGAAWQLNLAMQEESESDEAS